MSIKRLIEDFEDRGGDDDADDFMTVVLIAIAERMNRKGPKGFLYALDDLLLDASKKPWKQSLLVKAFKKIAYRDGVEGYSFNSAMQKTMSRYIEAAKQGSARIAPDPEREAEYEAMMRKYGPKN